MSCLLYRPSPTRRLAANNTEVVVSQCLENVKSGALPDAHNTVDPYYAIWELLTGSGTELPRSNIPGLQPSFYRRVILPRAFSAATVCGELMTLTDIQAAHDLVHVILRKWNGVIGACHSWPDGYRDENCSVLKDIAEEGAFGYDGPNEPARIIDYHVRKFLAYSGNSTLRHLEIVVKESTSLPLIVKHISWGYQLTRHQMIIIFFYGVDCLMKTIGVVLKQNKYNPCIQPGYYEEARHRVAIFIEYIGAINRWCCRGVKRR